jgi:hypothetical protein
MLNRTISRLLFLTVLAVSGMFQTGGLRAQDTIGFGPSGFSGMPVSVYAGDTVTVGAFVRNYSDSAYQNDTIQINGYVDTGSVFIPFSLPPVPAISMAAYDSVFFLIPIDFRDNYQGGIFRIGNNTIVIWPSMYNPNFATGDSLTATVLVIDTINSIGPGHEYDDGVRCYPVPGNGPLFIMSSNPSLRPSEAIVRDMNGKIVTVSKNPSAGIEMESWLSGIYFIEIIFDNGTSGIYKIMR